MKLFHHYHHHKLHTLAHSDFWNFELSVWLHMVGYSIISIFIPILMLSYGYSLPAVLLYVAIYSLLDTPLNFLASTLTKSLGARMVTVLATVSTIIYFLLFPFLSGKNFYILIILAVFAAMYDSFYWVAHLYLFMESGGGKEVGRNNGLLNGVRSFAGMLGPSLGAGILLFTGKSALLSVSIIFLVLSVAPLLFLRHTKDKPDSVKISYKEFFRDLPEKKNFISWFLYAVHMGVEGWIWPIFIFTVFGTLRSIALVAVAISLSKVILSYLSGIVNSANREKLILIGITATLLTWVLRLIYPYAAFYYLSILLMGFFAVLIEVPLDNNIFERAKLKRQNLVTSTYHNAIIMFPQGILFAILALLVGVFNVSFLSAIASLAILLLVNHLIFYNRTV